MSTFSEFGGGVSESLGARFGGEGFSVKKIKSPSTVFFEKDQEGHTLLNDDFSFERPVVRKPNIEISENSTPIEIWEGTVVRGDRGDDSMDVILEAKMEPMPRHTAQISLEWVSEQDLDLIKPGAVFYLTIFKRTKRGSIENSQELRFRRLPSWTSSQLARVQTDSKMILAKMKALRTDE